MTKPIEQARSATLRGTYAALVRAGRKAREMAAKAGIPPVIRENEAERRRLAASLKAAQSQANYGDKK